MDNSYISWLPLEIKEKITLLISDHRTMTSWLKYLPIVKNIQSVEQRRNILCKTNFTENQFYEPIFWAKQHIFMVTVIKKIAFGESKSLTINSI